MFLVGARGGHLGNAREQACARSWPHSSYDSQALHFLRTIVLVDAQNARIDHERIDICGRSIADMCWLIGDIDHAKRHVDNAKNRIVDPFDRNGCMACGARIASQMESTW